MFLPSVLEELMFLSKIQFKKIKLIENPIMEESKFHALREYEIPQEFSVNINGLINQSIFCYCNSVIQMFLGVPEFIYMFIEMDYFKSQIRKGKFSSSFQEVIKKNQMQNLKQFNADFVLKLFRTKIDLGVMQDSHEFMRLILDNIHEELKLQKYKKKKYKYTWENFRKYEISPVTSIFTGEQTRVTLCFNCFSHNEVREPLYDLSISIENHHEYLEDCIKEYFQPELIDGGINCDKCNQKSTVATKYYITELPKYLTIQIKRFSYFPVIKKIENNLKYKNKQKIDLTEYTLIKLDIAIKNLKYYMI